MLSCGIINIRALEKVPNLKGGGVDAKVSPGTSSCSWSDWYRNRSYVAWNGLYSNNGGEVLDNQCALFCYYNSTLNRVQGQ